MSAHRSLIDIHKANLFFQIPDPGNAGTIGGTRGVDRSPAFCNLTSTTSETRTLSRPSVAGDSVTIAGRVVGGTITVTVTGGYNVNLDTTFAITAANQFFEFISVFDGTSYAWRLTGSHAIGNSSLALPTPATPASVATSPATAAPAELTGTGGLGGNTTIATTGIGGVGGGYALTAGAGGVASAATTSATGGAGGAFTIVGGAGGAEAVVGAGNGIGGAGGAFSSTGGAGGAVTTSSGTNTGGAGGAQTLTGGVGGAATGGTDTGGVGGSVILTAGAGGAGDTGGAGGTVELVTGAVGTGGSPAAGKVLIKMAGTERWGFYGTTVGVLTSLGAVPTNINATGTILPGGGVAITDVLNAWIDDATHGSGTVAHLIGNQTITTASDVRIKKNVQPFSMACAAVKRAARTVTFEYDHPDWGGDRAALDDDNARKYGPNARGTYVGFLAQETKEVYPWIVNAGAGEHCPKCKAGLPCEDETHPFWHVEYQHLVPMLTAALKEMIVRVEKLEARLAG